MLAYIGTWAEIKFNILANLWILQGILIRQDKLHRKKETKANALKQTKKYNFDHRTFLKAESVYSVVSTSPNKCTQTWEPRITKPTVFGGKPLGKPKPPGGGNGFPAVFFWIQSKFKKFEKIYKKIYDKKLHAFLSNLV
jgi:hypothetical protein